MYDQSRAERRFGVDLDKYNRMLADQDGRCAICGSDYPGVPGRRFCVDHDHATGVVRALLCNGCNNGIGMLGDDPNRVRAAAAYLEKYRDHPTGM
jgi:hypothetical protein